MTAKVDAISRASRNPQFLHPAADGIAIAEIPTFNPAQALGDDDLGELVAEIPKPLRIGLTAILRAIADDLDHG